jgi:hypothetical protein
MTALDCCERVADCFSDATFLELVDWSDRFSRSAVDSAFYYFDRVDLSDCFSSSATGASAVVSLVSNAVILIAVCCYSSGDSSYTFSLCCTDYSSTGTSSKCFS